MTGLRNAVPILITCNLKLQAMKNFPIRSYKVVYPSNASSVGGGASS
jgi:hypothetical protein